MRKAIAIINQIPALKHIEDEFEKKQKGLTERMRFLKKQAESLAKEKDGLLDDVNKQRADYLREAGLLPSDYDVIKYHFHNDDGALVICDDHGGGLNDLLRLMTGKDT